MPKRKKGVTRCDRTFDLCCRWRCFAVRTFNIFDLERSPSFATCCLVPVTSASVLIGLSSRSSLMYQQVTASAQAEITARLEELSDWMAVYSWLLSFSCRRTCRRDYISPVLADLHWLPISARITYKIAILVFEIREVKQPVYLVELIEDYKPASCAQHLGCS